MMPQEGRCVESRTGYGDRMLPIEALRPELEATAGPLVISAPTGSGKSTCVPRWLAEGGARVLVVEPRRVACRALAQRTAELWGTPVGRDVGYAVRDERRASDGTRILFVTPGVALRMVERGDLDWDAVVLDELHERGLVVDLLLALLLRDGPRLVVMSATIEGDRVAAHIGGTHLRGTGRTFPVAVEHLPGRAVAPDRRGVEERVVAALDALADIDGDVLVFLPGKAEIASVGRALRGDVDVLALHGGLSLKEQARVFRPGPKRRVVLATNVAETSLTVPRIGAVVDSGLVRRTRYRGGRGSLTLLPIAQDSAEQRAGRAGRLGPGRCVRLWSERFGLAPRTPPEIQREDLTELVLAAAACGAPDLELPFLDPPRVYAVEAARANLIALGGLDEAGRLTERGRRLFGMTLDAPLGRLLLEAERRGTLPHTLALCAALATSRPLWAGRPDDPGDDLREGGCDATALIRAVLEGEPGQHELSRAALSEARDAMGRYRRLFDDVPPAGRLDRRALADTLLAAWPDCAHVARRRRRAVAWSNGGTELELGRDSAVDAAKVDFALALDSRSFGAGKQTRLVLAAAMPVPVQWLVAAGIGRLRVAQPSARGGRIRATLERVYAKRVLERSEEVLAGAPLREAARDLLLEGRLFRGAGAQVRDRHQARALHARLRGQAAPLPVEDELLDRLVALGLEEPGDLELLEAEDVLGPDLDARDRAELDHRYPRSLSIGDARYELTYDVARRRVTLTQVGGHRKTPPPPGLRPSLPGWRVFWSHKNRVREV